MAKVKTNELIGAALDWAVGVAEGRQPGAYKGVVRATAHPDCPDSPPMFGPELNYSTDWAQGGPILDRERITIRQWTGMPIIHAYMPHDGAPWGAGPTPLIAAMRCFCCSRLGREIEVPEALS